MIASARRFFGRQARRWSLRYERFDLGGRIKWAREELEECRAFAASSLYSDVARESAMVTFIGQASKRIDAINKELSNG